MKSEHSSNRYPSGPCHAPLQASPWGGEQWLPVLPAALGSLSRGSEEGVHDLVSADPLFIPRPRGTRDGKAEKTQEYYASGNHFT